MTRFLARPSRWMLIAACSLLPAASWAQNSTGPGASSVLPQVAFGDGWYTALYFTNYTGSPVSFPVSFISDNGTPLIVPSLGGSTAQVSVAAYGTAIVEAPNTGSLREGYAAFTLPDGVSGYGVFRGTAPGQQDQEAVVPLSDAHATSTTLTWDETANLVTAVAIVNPSSNATTVTVTLWDESGNTIGSTNLTLAAYSKTEAALKTLPGLGGMAGKRGSAQFAVSSGSVAVLGLRFNVNAFTSIPTTAGAATSTGGPRVLPQVAFGGGWYTALYFTNFTESPVTFPVSFISNAGTPLLVPSVFGSATQISLPAHGTAIVEAPNSGDLVQGYATFTLPGGVSGYGVFRGTVPGQQAQEAVVPLSDAAGAASVLTWDDTKFVTAVAIVNPSSTATSVAVTLWDDTGKTLGNTTIALPAHAKTAAALHDLPGLSGIPGKRGSALFSVSSGNVAVLGLRFNALAFTSIPTSRWQPETKLVAQRALAQTGLAVGQASIVLQSQLNIFMALVNGSTSCTPLDGGGAVRLGATASAVTLYYDSSCTKPYLTTTDLALTSGGDNIGKVSETDTYYGPDGTLLGTMALHASVALGDTTTQVNGLGLFTPASGARPVQLGVYCSLSETGGPCGGGIVQDFPALGVAVGAVTPIALKYGPTASAPVTFSGGGSAVSGSMGSLTLTNPAATSLVIQGGTAFTSTTCTGGAAAFVLFPPTPTGWTLTDSTHDQRFDISVVSNTERNLTFTIKQISSGSILASGALDQSGTGSITYSDGSIAAITNWTMAN